MTAVSVVMSTFNDASALAETLGSVLEQEMADFEFIVVNDGSTDPQASGILQQAAQSDSRIRVLNKRNEGLTKALIDGCAIARGEYIARIDAGDVMLPGRLASQAKVLEENPECAFVSCWTEFCGPEWEAMWLAKGAPESTQPVSILPDNPERGLLGDVPHHGSVMFRRSAYESVGGYRPEFHYGQDWDLWYRLADVGSFQVVPQSLYRARFFPSSISLTRKHLQDEMARCSEGAFIARKSGQDEIPWLQRAKASLPGSSEHLNGEPKANLEPGFYFIGEALRRRGNTRSRCYLVKAMQQSPTSLRAYVRWLQSWSLRSSPQT